MGTDIHGRFEVRYGADESYQREGNIEDGRNYRVFAMLANVRNGYGFAGVETHVPLTPISEPRGIPDDVVEMEDWEFGDHSCSWVTLHEVLHWPGWGKPLVNTGVIGRDEYERIQREGGGPESWCGGVSGPGIVIVDSGEADGGSQYTHVRYRWETQFEEMCPTFRKWLDYLESKYGWLLESDPAAVRLVFGFDS